MSSGNRQTEVTVSIIHTSPLPEVEIPEQPITAFVLRMAAEMPDRIALTDGHDSTYTFSELSTAIHSLAGGLQSRGFAKGTTLAVMAPNNTE